MQAAQGSLALWRVELKVNYISRIYLHDTHLGTMSVQAVSEALAVSIKKKFTLRTDVSLALLLK